MDLKTHKYRKSIMSGPVVVLYKSKTCTHCKNISAIWNDIKEAMKSVNPDLRFFELTANDNSGIFDENIAPKSLVKYGRWFPMVLLVPGRLWDAGMANKGPNSKIEMKEGVQIINGRWNGDNVEHVNNYDIRRPSEFARWLKDAQNKEDFKKVQNGTGPFVPTTDTTKPIQPFLGGIIGTNNNTSRRAAAFASKPDICSMKIISRPL